MPTVTRLWWPIMCNLLPVFHVGCHWLNQNATTWITVSLSLRTLNISLYSWKNVAIGVTYWPHVLTVASFHFNSSHVQRWIYRWPVHWHAANLARYDSVDSIEHAGVRTLTLPYRPMSWLAKAVINPFKQWSASTSSSGLVYLEMILACLFSKASLYKYNVQCLVA